MPDKKINAAVYCRVASEYNDETEQQKETLRIFAESNKIPLSIVTDPLKLYDWLRVKKMPSPDTKK